MKKIKKKILLSEKEKEEILADWLGRDPEGGYVFTSPELLHKVDHTGSSMSAKIMEGRSLYDVMKRVYRMGVDMLIAMNLPKRARLKIDPNHETGATDGVNVWVTTKMFKEEGMELDEQMDVFLGTTVHEGCHIKYTDFEARKKYPTELHLLIDNIVDDEHIERRLGADLPGFSGFIERSKNYWFDRVYLKGKEIVETKKVVKSRETLSKESVEVLELMDKFMDVMFKIIRYPKYLLPEDLDEVGDLLRELKGIIIPYPTTSKEVQIATNKIYELLRSLLTKELAEKIAEAKKEAEEKMKGSEGKKEKGEGEDGDEEKGDGGEPATVELTEEEYKKILGAIKEAMEMSKAEMEAASKEFPVGTFMEFMRKMGEEVDEKDIPKELLASPLTLPDIEGTLDKVAEDVAFLRVEGDKEEYNKSLHRIRRFIPPLARQLELRGMEMKWVERGMRTGLLDTGKLVEGAAGCDTIYIREGMRSTSRYGVILVEDESGSMGGRKIQAARDTGVLLKEVLERTPNVLPFIYGHSADQLGDETTEIYVYEEPGRKNNKYALGSVDSRSQNRDGVALYHIAKRVRTFTDVPCLMIVISDGVPCASEYHGYTHTRSMVQLIQKTMGMQVVQIAIEAGMSPGLMFDHFIKLLDMNRLAIDLGKVVRKAIEKNTTVVYG